MPLSLGSCTRWWSVALRRELMAQRMQHAAVAPALVLVLVLVLERGLELELQRRLVRPYHCHPLQPLVARRRLSHRDRRCWPALEVVVFESEPSSKQSCLSRKFKFSNKHHNLHSLSLLTNPQHAANGSVMRLSVQ